ncbi:MAG: dihydroorotate dehydrogenase B catalytic subunit [Candidatus Marinimicrobia bacterium]|nr:dihydroorotate dehydrogenase B catalytic subunit [Candidatus Neomarinimicrobiota bacterium]|tara:strand:+ start:946 stop:1869 length:924 start_codon:yes stop_codon:yes gene_type:complete
MKLDLEINLGDQSFKNPLFVASGTYGYGIEANDLSDSSKLGAIITKSITRFPREGNPPPRIVETPSGMINSIGLANMGVEKYIDSVLPQKDKIGTEIITNVAGFSISDYLFVIEKLESIEAPICGYEINISCPNVEAGKMEFAVDDQLTGKLTENLRAATDKLLIIKLSPNVTDIKTIATAASQGGADAVSAINTVFGMSINVHTKKPNINTDIGGLSGPAIKPIGIANVYKIFKSIDIPIIGIGGITSAKDVIEYMLAGASAVQIGTANYRDIGIAQKILNDLKIHCRTNRIEKISKITGKVETNY